MTKLYQCKVVTSAQAEVIFDIVLGALCSKNDVAGFVKSATATHDFKIEVVSGTLTFKANGWKSGWSLGIETNAKGADGHMSVSSHPDGTLLVSSISYGEIAEFDSAVRELTARLNSQVAETGLDLLS
jgi:hypothetical protein